MQIPVLARLALTEIEMTNLVLAPGRAIARRPLGAVAIAMLMTAIAVPARADLPSRLFDATAQGEGRAHIGPRGYHRMCVREPDLCRFDVRDGQTPGASAPRTLTRSVWRELKRINRDLNWQIVPVADNEAQGISDHWTLGRSHGDCEDYVIAKKHALIAAGWNPDQLLYAVVEGRYSPYHLVLVVRTDKGDLVLDNLRDRITAWEESGYEFVVRQKAADPTKWAIVTTEKSQVAAAAVSVSTR